MTLPEFVYSLAFWKSATFAVAGVLALLAYFGVVPLEWAVPVEGLLAGVLAVLNAFGIYPEVLERRARLLAARKVKKSK